jgi:predicted nucleic acid-binding protein
MIVVLDSGIVSLLIHPRGSDESAACNEWVEQLIQAGHEVISLEIVDYEVRRELLRRDNQASLKKLDRLQSSLTYFGLTTNVMRSAAQVWADARRQGSPTAGDNTIDCDMIIVAQTRDISAIRSEVAVVATTNVRHLGRFVDARLWRDVTP